MIYFFSPSSFTFRSIKVDSTGVCVTKMLKVTTFVKQEKSLGNHFFVSRQQSRDSMNVGPALGALFLDRGTSSAHDRFPLLNFADFLIQTLSLFSSFMLRHV